MFFSRKNIVNYLPLMLFLLSVACFSNEKFDQKLKSIDIKTTQDTHLKMSDVKQPIVILNFWASWCGPCIGEFKSLNYLIEKVGKDKILVLGINNDEESPLKKIKEIERKHDLKFESVMDEKESFTEKFMVSRIPTSIIFINKKFYKMIPESFDFSDKNFIKEIKTKAKILD